MAYVGGEKVEVWSNSKGSWIPDAIVLEAPATNCEIDGYAIPAGSLKVQSSVGTKWILPDQVRSQVRKAQPQPGMTDSLLAPPSAVCSPCLGVGASALCKWGCGRSVQPGLTRGMKPFDTCCKKCSMTSGTGGHDENCGGHVPAAPRRTIVSGPDPRQWLQAKLSSKDALSDLARTVMQKATGSTAACNLTAPQVKDAVSKYLLETIDTGLNVDDRAAAEWVTKFGSGSALDLEGLVRLVEFVLLDRLNTWFPTKLPAKTHSFVRKNAAKLEDVYEVGKLLGEGSFGKVYKVTHRISSETRVCKKIAKIKGAEGMKMEEILAEIESMAMLDHPNVIKVYEYFEDRDSVAQIMEPCSGGELQETIEAVHQKGGPSYSETFICDVMKQTLRALAFMHGNRYMHKDLKPQNIMLVDKGSSSIKVIDFGLAELFQAHQETSDAFGGTLLYMAPEVFQYKLGMKSDVWSAGCILYNLYTGDYPFMAPWPLPKGRTMEWWQQELARSIQSDPMRQNPKLAGWSREGLDLLQLMLHKDVDRRPDAAQCLDHAWFTKFAGEPPPLSVGVTQCLEAFAGQPELKKAIFLLIAHMCNAPALNELRAIFTHFDTQNRGVLSCAQFRDVLQKSGMKQLQVEKIVHALDQDASGGIEWTEFVAAALCVSACRNERLVRAAFAVFDKDRDGKVTKRDFADVFAQGGVQDIWEKHLEDQLTLLGTPGPGGTYTQDQFTQYVGRRMVTTAGDALKAVH